MPTVDYFISSSKLDSNESRHHYTENLVLLEHLPFCYDEPEVPEEMLSRAELGISTELKLYAVIQNILKIHPDMDDVFDQILSNDNSGALVIIGSDKKGKHEALKARLKPLFTKYPDRIFLLERQASVGYFSIIRHAHIILDTFYYNAGANTNADVLACNKPFVTHEWDQHRGRFSAGVYNQMQIENAPIATSKEEYIELALKLANDEKYRLHIEHQIESNKDLFFNTIEAVSDLENFVQKAIQDAFPRKSFDKSNVKKKLTQEIPKPISVKTLASVSIPELLVKMDNSLLTKDFIEVEKTGWEVLEKDPYNKSAADKLLIISDLKSDLDLANKVRKLGIPELENDAIDIFRKALYVPTFPSSSEAQAYLDLAISQLNEIDLNEDFEMENLKFFNFSSIWKTLHYGVPLREFKIAFAHAVMKNLPPFRYKRKRFERDKIRIGYLVTKDHHAIFIKSMSGIIHKMDKDRFEIVVIADEINLFEIEEQFRDNVLIYKSLSDDIRANIAEIYDLELDILHYWEVGTDSLNYFLPFFRLAHKQCTSWGVPSTSGIPTIDSYITFQYMEIPEAESQYTEKLVVVNSLPSVFWEGQAIEESAFSALDLPTGKNIYTCTQRLSKFQPIMDEVCKGILEKDEHGIIVLIEDKNEFLTEKVKNRLEKIIPNYKDKIFMVPRLDPMRYKSLLKNAKVYLDTAYYSGANTTIDAITNDLPIVFFKGNNQRSLCTYAIFRHMDIEPIQCDTVVEYVTEATRLVLDQEYRKISINEVRENKHKIFEQLSVVKEYEKAYSSIHNSD
jgi:predicted O-linked N-acetylglucosamine transferase (SPINDLY family)